MITGKHRENYLTKMRKTSSRPRIFAAVGLAVIILIGFLSLLSPVSKPAQARDVIVRIPPEATAAQVAVILKQKEVIKSPVVFRVYSRYQGMDGLLKAGEYRISTSLSTPEILHELVDGRLAVQTITVPEGFTTERLADLLVENGLVARDQFFLSLANDHFPYLFVQGLPSGSNRRLEGYLYPDTYQVTRGSGEHAVIELMLSRFEKEINDLNYAEKASRAGLTLNEAVTIASMIESEARVDQERPLIAGVIFNRLQLNMPLQIDATVQYALNGHKERIYYKDLEVDSPYNTYRITGLPPGPIAMPGRSSLLAAVNPAQTNDLYYVAKPDGTHAFATTLEEHNLNREKYQPE
jgi:UPF0755 protein